MDYIRTVYSDGKDCSVRLSAEKMVKVMAAIAIAGNKRVTYLFEPGTYKDYGYKVEFKTADGKRVIHTYVREDYWGDECPC